MKRVLLSLVALATICIGTNAQEVFRLGIIGLDTSHSARFSQLLNDPESPDPIVRKFEVVVAYPYGTTTIESASKRIPQYIEEVQKYGVKVVDSIQEVLDQVDGVFIETNDGRLNDIRGMHVTPQMVIDAITSAHGGLVEQGSVGAGTGTICFGFKGGIGTSSRVLPESLGGYTIGVLVQTNYGGILEIDGVQVGQRLHKYDFINHVQKTENVDGSCMMVVVTDAPLDSRNLERVAKRAMMGMAKTGGIASNGSGDYVIALSVAPENLIDSRTKTITSTVLANSEMSSIFAATIEATAEALWNSLFMAEPMTGKGGYHVDALPVDQVLDMLRNRN